jgi:hypothetical protein
MKLPQTISILNHAAPAALYGVDANYISLSEWVVQLCFIAAATAAVLQVLTVIVCLPDRLRGEEFVDHSQGLRLLEVALYAAAGVWWYVWVQVVTIAVLTGVKRPEGDSHDD